MNKNACSVSRFSIPAAYWELTKPRLSMLVIMTALAGYYLGKIGNEPPILLFHLILGISLLIGGANAFNQWLEKDVDLHMKRTSARPLPLEKLSSKAAFWFALLTSLSGLLYISLFINLFTGLLGALALVSYAFVYTPLKKITTLATLVGAIPGAIPIMMGWAAARDQLNLGAWSLFFILFLWQLPHFLAIGWRCREDYRSAKLSMLPAMDTNGMATGRQMVIYALALVPVSLVPTFVGLTGPVYFVGALIGSIVYAIFSFFCALKPSDRNATRLFFVSVYYLLAILILMALDKHGSFLARELSVPQKSAEAQYLENVSQKTLPSFNFVDQNRNKITQTDLLGKLWVADFIFTRCGMSCPKMTSRMASLQDMFRGDPLVKFVSFSVDPEYDTSDILRDFAKSYRAEDGQWFFLTGEEKSIYALAHKFFGLGAGSITEEDKRSGAEEVLHSERFVLVGTDGKIINFFNGLDGKAAEDLKNELVRLKKAIVT